MPSALDAFHAPASRNPCKERCRERGFNEAMSTVKHMGVAGLLVPLGWTHLGTPVADQPGPSDGVIRGNRTQLLIPWKPSLFILNSLIISPPHPFSLRLVKGPYI